MSKTPPGTLEAILLELDKIPSGRDSDRDYELVIPNQLTWKGKPVVNREALNIAQEKLYCKGYQPESFTQTTNGFINKFISAAPGNLEVGFYNELQRRLFEIFLNVSCDERNFKTFSISLASTFLDAGSYFDSLAQTFIRSRFNSGKHFKAETKAPRFAEKIRGQSNKGKPIFFDMGDYRTLFEEEFVFSDKILNLNTHGDDFYSSPTACLHDPARCHDVQPFKTWASDKSPAWWTAFTNVKHDRIQFIHEATLENTLNAVGAVLILLTFYRPRFMQRNSRALETYRLFTPRYWKFETIMMVGNPVFSGAS
jgi:hypothetical protein